MKKFVSWPIAAIALFFYGCTSNRNTESAYEPPPALFSENPSLNVFNQWMPLYTLQMMVRKEPTDRNMEDIDRGLASFKHTLDAMSQQIDAAAAYLIRHPNAYQSSSLTKAREVYTDYLHKYEDQVKYFQPYQAEYVIEKHRSETRKAKFKQLVLSFIKIKQIPSDSVLDSETCVFYVEGAVLNNGRIVIHSHLSILPDCSVSAGNLDVHASINGQSLGRVGTAISVDGKSWNPYKQENNIDYSHTVDVDDLNIPPTGTIDLIVNIGSDFSGAVKVAYSNSEHHVARIGGTIVLKGRKEGNHLFLPVKFQAAGKELTTECLVDTGASITTVPLSAFAISSKEVMAFSTANGEVINPIATSSVTVGDITKEIKIALSSDDRAYLLGANFFESFVFTVDLENSAIYLVSR